jgi:hypothetical protein
MMTCPKPVICLLLLIFPSGCSKWAARPADVPTSAVHVGNVFVDCSVDERSRANRCTVYKDASGDIIVSGFFELSGSGSEANAKELAYAAFDGTRIWLQDARYLRPASLVEYAVSDMTSRQLAFAGNAATNCGRVAINQKPNNASLCAQKAYRARESFYVSYDQKSWGPGYTLGLAGDAKGNMYFVDFAYEGWPPQPPSSEATLSEDRRIRFGPCPRPQALFPIRNGELTCIPQTD